MADNTASNGTGEGTKSNDSTSGDDLQVALNKKTEMVNYWLAKATDLEKKLAQFKDIDPVEYKAIKEDYNSMKEKLNSADTGTKPNNDEKMRRFKEEIENPYKQKLSQFETEAQKTAARLKELTVENKAVRKITEIFADDVHEDVKRALLANTALKDDDVVIVDADGNVKYSNKEPGKPMSMDEWLHDYANNRPSMVKTKATGGAREPGTSKPSLNGVLSVDSYRQMSPQERQKLKPEDRLKLATQSLTMK